MDIPKEEKILLEWEVTPKERLPRSKWVILPLLIGALLFGLDLYFSETHPKGVSEIVFFAALVASLFILIPLFLWFLEFKLARRSDLYKLTSKGVCTPEEFVPWEFLEKFELGQLHSFYPFLEKFVTTSVYLKTPAGKIYKLQAEPENRDFLLGILRQKLKEGNPHDEVLNKEMIWFAALLVIGISFAVLFAVYLYFLFSS